MSKQRCVRIEIGNGRVVMDFDGFTGGACGREEDKIIAFFERLGVRTDVKHSDNKRENEVQETPQAARLEN